uniref:Uncharacterized protein n=1 Tax=Octopus bimaculoides TaxID=37653 RepID=A0A0L8FGJ3_OCTBM
MKETIVILKNKAAGPDRIPAEIYKISSSRLHGQIHQHLIKIWTNEEIPSDFRDSATVKKKGEQSECGDYRGISILKQVLDHPREPLYICILRFLHHDMFVTVLVKKGTSDHFQVKILLKSAKTTSNEAHIIESQLRQSGHVVGMSDD